jgi:sugar phosphate isomerase/epimerase
LGISKLATRVSDFEDINTAIKSGSEWIWLDSFTGNWSYLPDALKLIKGMGHKTCLVSPELQRTDSEIELKELKELIKVNNLEITAVCTKHPESWI